MTELSSLKTRLLFRGISTLESRPWRYGSPIVLITPNRPSVPVRDIQKARQVLLANGIHEATTTALRAEDASKFLAEGFVVREKLHLLSRSTRDTPAPKTYKVQNSRPWENKHLVSIDRLCFDDFWKFDLRALQVAKTATQIRTTRVVRLNGEPAGYAVSGAVDTVGYLQRLAVNPKSSGTGIGTDLVLDSLQWLARKGAHKAMVNTQLTNQPAMALYEKLGFELEAEGLVVLKWQRSSD